VCVVVGKWDGNFDKRCAMIPCIIGRQNDRKKD
jgi:hypothetical protein